MKNYIGIIVLVVVSYSVGRYMSPEKIKTEIKTVEVEKVVTKTERKRIHITEDEEGMMDALIIIDSSTQENTHENSFAEEKEVIIRDDYNVSIMAGAGLPYTNPVFGASIQKRFIGPVTLGVWGLSNKTGGVSIGLNF
jgi:hypothetical protein